MKINTGMANLFRYGNGAVQNANAHGNGQNMANGMYDKNSAGSRHSIRNVLAGNQRADQNTPYSSNIAESSFSYADSIRESRLKAKDTSLKLKKLHYDFKSISTQIMRSKTSVSARQVASKARREVMRLKRQRQNGEYDDEELQSAISHAEAMERVAKKKARHLEEEEMVKVTGGPCAGELEEKEEQEDGALDEVAKESSEESAKEEMNAAQDAAVQAATENVNAASRERMQVYQEVTKAQMEELREMMEAQMEELREMMEAHMEELQRAMEEQSEEVQMQASSSMEDMMAEMMDEMADSMKELLEESGLAELEESMFATAETEMDPADYKMMKIKHRSEEMKAIAKADAEYLKALFDKLEKMKGSSMGDVLGSSGGSSTFGGISTGGGMVIVDGGSSAVSMPKIDVSSLAGDVAVPSSADAGGGFDVSI